MNLHAFSLTNETALITGGGSGLGLGIARCMVEAGAKVILVGRRAAELEKAAEELGPNAFPVAQDITKTGEAPELIARCEKASDGPITILVNNAGIHLKKPAEETGVEEFQNVLQTHVFAAQALTTAVLPSMLERRHGNILFTSSMAGLFGIPLVSAYSTAKTGLIGLTRSLAVELSGRGVRVNAIAPGWIESPMLRGALDNDPARSEKILGRTPMGCFGEPADIGWAAVYLCSNAAKFVTGAVVPVDGGAAIGF